MELPMLVLPTPGGPCKMRILPCTLPRSLPTAMNSRMRSWRVREGDEGRAGGGRKRREWGEVGGRLDVLDPVVILIQDAFGLDDVEVVLALGE